MTNSKCIILLRLSLEPLSLTGTMTQSPPYMGILTMLGSGLPTRLSSLLIKVEEAMRMGLSSDYKALFIGTHIC